MVTACHPYNSEKTLTFGGVSTHIPICYYLKAKIPNFEYCIKMKTDVFLRSFNIKRVLSIEIIKVDEVCKTISITFQALYEPFGQTLRQQSFLNKHVPHQSNQTLALKTALINYTACSSSK